MYHMQLEPHDSTLISEIMYDEDTKELWIKFNKYYVDHLTYVNVPLAYFMEFSQARSFGKFYLEMIKPIFKQKTPQKMADKVIKCKIDVRKILKEWIFAGEKGDYLNFTVLYNEEKNDKGQNGMITQDVPTEIYKKDKTVKGPILGNCMTFDKKGADPEAQPGVESGQMGGVNTDDLPF